MAGGNCWVERRLFTLLGEWVPSTAGSDLKLMLDRHSQHCAWRAAQWWDRLPELADVDRDSLVAPPPGGLEAALAAMADLATPVGRLAACYRVALPRLWSAYASHRLVASAVGDPSSLRTLGIVSADVAADWMEGEATLQSLLGGPGEVEEAGAVVVAVERLLIGEAPT